jgi:E3 ubiquitin-protein ligase EDD1
MLLCY